MPRAEQVLPFPLALGFSAMGLVAYNREDAEQNAFLATVRQLESGGNYYVGNGGANLAGAPVDQYGFPQWSGQGNSHAAGAYQFQPGTWKEIASRFGLNFQNKADQDEGAWYNAQIKYSDKTGGRDLDADLDAGKFQFIQQTLSMEWTSFPKGFAKTIAGYLGSSPELSEGATDTNGTPSLLTSPVEAAKSYFVRGGMVLTGAIILLVALWALLNSGVIGKAAKLAS